MADNFSSQILRGDLGGALIPDEISQEIIQTLPQSSVLLTRARRVPMSSKKKTQPVLAAFRASGAMAAPTSADQPSEVQSAAIVTPQQ